MSGEARRVVVIGAGLAGLSAATYLRLNGYEVDVFEAAPRPGGVALTRWEPDALVQGGVYFLLECFPGEAAYELYETLGVVPWEGVVPMETYVELVDQPTGARLRVTRDLDKLAADLHKIAPEDREFVDAFVSGAKGFRRFDPAKASFEKPPELTSFFDKLALGWHARHVLGVFSNTKMVKQSIADWIAPAKSEALRELMLGFFPYPTVPPFFAMMVLGQLGAGQLGRVVASPEELVARVSAKCEALGVRIHCGKPVRKVRFAGDRAAGVELEDGAVHEAHAVVSTVDSGQLLRRLIPGKGAGSLLAEQWERWPRAKAGAYVNFVTRGSWEDAPWYVQARLARPIETGDTKAERVAVRFFLPGTGGAGPGECAVETSCDASFAWFTEGDEATKRARRGRFIADVRAQLDGIFPGFSSRVLREEAVTPDVFARAVRAPDGNTGAYLPTIAAMDVESPRTLADVPGLYLAGQWAIAGAGVLAVLYSGRHVAQLLCRDDGHAFHKGAAK